MNKIYRQIIQKLVISDYRKWYKLRKNNQLKSSNSKFIYFYAFIVFTAFSCKKNKEINQLPNIKTEQIDSKQLAEKKKKTILFYGNSLTAGYGLDPSESFPANIERMIDSLKMDYSVVNAGLSGETTSGGLQRLDWVLNQKVDIFVLELGANDMLRGLPLSDTKNNLQAIINKVRTKDPSIRIVLCEMMAAPNMGNDYVKSFSEIYKNLSQSKDITFLPFFLDGVAGNEKLLLQDGKHPNSQGQKIVAKNVWKVLKKLL